MDRGAELAMKHFEDLIGGLQKNPDASIAGIQGILRTAHNINPGVQNQGWSETRWFSIPLVREHILTLWTEVKRGRAASPQASR